MKQDPVFIGRTESPHSRKLLDKYWKEFEKIKTDPLLPNFSLINDDEFQTRRQKDLRLLEFLDRNINMIMEPVAKSPVVFALFDDEGCLLDFYGRDSDIIRLKGNGLLKRALWDMRNIGPNAVTVGLVEGRAMVSLGEDNYHERLRAYALYFSPIKLWRSKPPFDTVNYGGLAVIVPAERHNPDYLILASAITHDLIMTLHFNQTVFMLYERSGRGILSIDTKIHPDEETIVYCGENLFELLGFPRMELGFKPASALFDPLPANREFWSIIKERKRVTDYSLTLTGHGRHVFCIISTDVFQQPMINAGGVIIYITTPQAISASVSAKIANSAVRSFDNIIGQSDILQSAIQRGKMLARTDSNVMLLGESGVGKDVFAQAIHNASRRRDKPFVAVNCGALPRDLIASELFGYSPGAFTGAKKQGNIGKFELANGGTIFLDEIGDLPLDLQVSLLRVTEQKQLMRLGGHELISVDVKIISATNADITAMIEHKRFRADLYYRLSAMRLNIPSLRERGDDIVLLADYFINTISSRIGHKEVMRLSQPSKELLLSLPWQGNVRELQNLVESIVQLYSGRLIEPQHIIENLHLHNLEFLRPAPAANLSGSSHGKYNPTKSSHGKYNLTEQDIKEALERTGGNRSEAARYLGVARKTFYRHLERLGL